MKNNHPVLLSIHDIMPETLGRVMKLIAMLEKNNIVNATCLIVPGRSWDDKQIQKLHDLESMGFDLAGHGWNHLIKHKKSFYHYFHSVLLSRDVAEHLSLTSEEIIQLMLQCADWFGDNNFKTPYTYVPPAWAIGDVTWEDLSVLPYMAYETLTGIYHKDTFHTLPLVGYEADNLFRTVSVKILNKTNNLFSIITNRPLRLSIHPYDLELGLASDLKNILNKNLSFFSYKQFFENMDNQSLL